MIAYLDSSVLLRIVLNQPQQLPEWSTITVPVMSVLAEIECLRTLDRARHRGLLSTAAVNAARAFVTQTVARAEVLSLGRTVLAWAGQPLPVPLATLDALHLASALLWRAQNSGLVMATHDTALATAARAHALPVIGA